MKFFYYPLVAFIVLNCSVLFSQVGVGTNTPEQSSILDVQSSNKGVLFPRINLTSTTDQVTILNPVNGLVVYNTNTENDVVANNLYYWDGNIWKLISSSAIPEIKTTVLACSIEKTTNQELTKNVIEPIVFEQTNYIFNQLISYNDTTGEFIAKREGHYTINLQVGFIPEIGSEENGDHILGVIDSSNNWIGRATFGGGTKARQFGTYSVTLFFNANDVFKMGAVSSSGAVGQVEIEGIQTGSTGDGNVTNVSISYFED